MRSRKGTSTKEAADIKPLGEIPRRLASTRLVLDGMPQEWQDHSGDLHQVIQSHSVASRVGLGVDLELGGKPIGHLPQNRRGVFSGPNLDWDAVGSEQSFDGPV